MLPQELDSHWHLAILTEPIASQVAHVTGIHETKKDQARLKVYWYYFPDDVPRGRQVLALGIRLLGVLSLCILLMFV